MPILWWQGKAEIPPCAVLAVKIIFNCNSAIRMVFRERFLGTANMAIIIMIACAYINARYIVCLSGRRRMRDAGVSFQ